MKSIKNIYFTISFIVLLLLVGSIIFLKQESKRDKLAEIRGYAIDDFEKVLAYENANLLSFTLALSEDGALKSALKNGNHKEGKQLLNRIAKRFKENTYVKDLRLQLLTNDFKIFEQNWKKVSNKKSLLAIRPDLKHFQNSTKPKVGIQTGRRLTFKATIPIEYGEEQIGYLEVIKFIDDFSEKLKQQGVEVCALMQPKYLTENSLMKEFPRMKSYVVANENCNKQIRKKIEFIDWNRLMFDNYFQYDGMLFLLKDMHNGQHTKIGKYLIVLPNRVFEEYREKHQDVSLLTRFSDEDIYNWVKRWTHSNGSYRTVKERELVENLSKVPLKDKVSFRKLAKKVLQKYTKQELIDIVLNRNHRENKRGKIE